MNLSRQLQSSEAAWPLTLQLLKDSTKQLAGPCDNSRLAIFDFRLH